LSEKKLGGKYRVEISVPIPAKITEVVGGFPQYLKANAEALQ
jgi:hypothetical protein